MTIAEHHRMTLPDVFTLNTQRVGELDWELSITVNRDGGLNDEGIYPMLIVVHARRWGKTKVLRRPKLLSFAELTYVAEVHGTRQTGSLHGMDEHSLQGLALAEEFLFRNRVRVDQLIELDDRIVTGDCRCDDCNSSFGPIPTAQGWGGRTDSSWLFEISCPAAGELGSR